MNIVLKQALVWSMLLGAFVVIQVHAIELSVKRIKGQLSVTLSEIDYPAQFIEKELDSGLPNTISLVLSLTANKQRRHTVNINTQVLYDLWDEVYIVNQVGSDGIVSKRSIKTKAALVQYLDKIVREHFIDVNQLDLDKRHQLQAQVIVNPVKTERIKKIQAWIASSNGFIHREENNRPSSAHTVTAGGFASSGPRFQKLFDQILEQYMSTEQIPALWRSKLVTIEVELK